MKQRTINTKTERKMLRQLEAWYAKRFGYRPPPTLSISLGLGVSERIEQIKNALLADDEVAGWKPVDVKELRQLEQSYAASFGEPPPRRLLCLLPEREAGYLRRALARGKKLESNELVIVCD